MAFRVVVITPPGLATPGEVDTSRRLLAAGLDRLHLRKPGASAAQLSEYLAALPPAARRRVVLHSHHELIKGTSVGGIHYREADRPPGAIKAPGGLAVSTSFHQLQDLLVCRGDLDYGFLSPIYDSLSKEGYRGAFADRDALADGLAGSRHPVLALGGVTPEHFAELAEWGFAGAALLGGVAGAVGRVAGTGAFHFNELTETVAYPEGRVFELAEPVVPGFEGLQLDTYEFSAGDDFSGEGLYPGSVLETDTLGGLVFVSRPKCSKIFPIGGDNYRLPSEVVFSFGGPIDVKGMVIKSVNVKAPGAPTIASVTVAGTKLAFVLNKPSSNGGVAITQYRVVATPPSGAAVRFTLAPTAIAGKPTQVTSALSKYVQGTKYTFKAYAINAVGSGATSRALASRVPFQAGTYTLTLVGRAPCATKGFAKAFACPTSNTAVTLTTAGGALARFELKPVTGTNAVANLVRIIALGRGACAKVVQPDSNTCSNIRAFAKAATTQLWLVRESSTSPGNYRIQSVGRAGCTTKYLGASNTCSATSLRMVTNTAGSPTSSLWRLAKA
ncbi:thiamine phosphate synthase isoform B [Micractinium conductrix]|uniref:Thiamine phosphate synthase isoform B n=1 Tax=Micractinium conductrix TaxID=554055 RepID=A0A2P6V3V3_9CHLO|nr:thiamine phosphate synthase isoform B [Micractinium conductrix]|eukprot:PSC68769.1 thiamine phosphate synthase isoform B [Micractinium conductrix]